MRCHSPPIAPRFFRLIQYENGEKCNRYRPSAQRKMPHFRKQILKMASSEHSKVMKTEHFSMLSKGMTITM